MKILGAEESVKVFERIIRDPTNATGPRRRAGWFENCGSVALPVIAWALNDKNQNIRYQAATTAAIIDTEGTLYNQVAPMLVGETEHVLYAVKKYLLAQGIRRFHVGDGRWPSDFAEVHAFIRKANPVVNLTALGESGKFPFIPQDDGSLKVGGHYVIAKPSSK